MKSDNPTSFKDRLNQDVHKQVKPSNDSHLDDSNTNLENTHHNSRDNASASTILFTSEQDKRSFAYSYLLNVGMDNKTGIIDLNFTSAKIQIQGKNLNQLFLDLHRHKVAEVDIAAEDIDDLTITLNNN